MDQADGVMAAVREVLGDAVLGGYLFGSAVAAGLRPTSDIDVLVVSARPGSDDAKRRLIGRILPISGRGDPSGAARSVELTIVVQRDVVPWRYPPRLEFQYGDWWRSEFEAGAIAPWESPNPDVALLVEQVLGASEPLFGPPATELLDPVPPADVRRAMLDGIPGLLADLVGDERNVLLTFARIWATLETGRIWPKDQAADWVLARLPAGRGDVLAHASAIYLGEAAEDWGDLLSGVRPLVDHLHAEILEAAERRPAGR